MELQDRYDELDNLINSLDSLIGELTDKNYIEQLELIKFEAQNDFKEVVEQLQKQREQEERQEEKEYWEAVVWWKYKS